MRSAHSHASLARVDQIGAVVSVACAAHCLAAPFLLLAFASVHGLTQAHDTLHRCLVLGSVLLGVLSLGRGFRHHRRRRVLVFLALATLLLAAGQSGPEGPVETVLTVVGALVLATGHWVNYRLWDACALQPIRRRAAAPASSSAPASSCNHRVSRRPLAWAVGLNSAVLIVEVAGSGLSGSVSLLADAAHNLADECGLICLWIAYAMPMAEAQAWRRAAMVLNVAGALLLSAWITWEVFERWSQPVEVHGPIMIACGLLAAIGNMGVAATLQAMARRDNAVRVAFLHNVGDAIISLIPVMTGILVTVTRIGNIDALVGLSVAAFVLVGTLRVVWVQAFSPPPVCLVCSTVAHD
jgi:cobalt-zinc-cadmium efflux system protein